VNIYRLETRSALTGRWLPVASYATAATAAAAGAHHTLPWRVVDRCAGRVVEEAPLNRVSGAAGAMDGPTPTRVPGAGREGVSGKQGGQ